MAVFLTLTLLVSITIIPLALDIFSAAVGIRIRQRVPFFLTPGGQKAATVAERLHCGCNYSSYLVLLHKLRMVSSLAVVFGRRPAGSRSHLAIFEYNVSKRFPAPLAPFPLISVPITIGYAPKNQVSSQPSGTPLSQSAEANTLSLKAEKLTVAQLNPPEGQTTRSPRQILLPAGTAVSRAHQKELVIAAAAINACYSSITTVLMPAALDAKIICKLTLPRFVFGGQTRAC